MVKKGLGSQHLYGQRASRQPQEATEVDIPGLRITTSGSLFALQRHGLNPFKAQVPQALSEFDGVIQVTSLVYRLFSKKILPEYVESIVKLDDRLASPMRKLEYVDV
ncbi:hypothetical protein GCM10009429_38490 [Dyella marensis]